MRIFIMKISIHKAGNQTQLHPCQISLRGRQLCLTAFYLLTHSPPDIQLPGNTGIDVVLGLWRLAPSARAAHAALGAQLRPKRRAGPLQGCLGGPMTCLGLFEAGITLNQLGQPGFKAGVIKYLPPLFFYWLGGTRTPPLALPIELLEFCPYLHLRCLIMRTNGTGTQDQ